MFASHVTITLTGSQLELSNTTETETITGPAAGVTIDAGGLSRVFQVDALVTASISGLTITGGNASLDGGGGVKNFGILALTNCTVTGNSAYSGGGLQIDGTATLTNCTVSGNNSATFGGGGGLYISGAATLTNCTVSGNSANLGGGVFTSGTATLTHCTVSGNFFSGFTLNNAGGGVFNSGTLALTNCTVSGNSASDGGGLSNFGTLTLTNCTVSGNSARRVGGVENKYRRDGLGQHDRRRQHIVARLFPRRRWPSHFSGQQPDRCDGLPIRLERFRPNRELCRAAQCLAVATWQLRRRDFVDGSATGQPGDQRGQ